MNKVILSGRLTRDADIRYSQGENAMAIARFTLAVDRRSRRSENSEQTADFISCVAFDKTAEVVERYCKQGTKLVVEGRWQTGSYTNKDGQKVYTNDCMVENLEFAESKATSEGGTYSSSRPEPVDTDGFMNIPQGIDDSDGLPFS